MEYRSFAKLRDAAAIETSPRLFGDRSDALRRWAQLLEREPTRRFPTLHELERVRRSEHSGLRANGSALALAFADPSLRAAGLRDDTYGAARTFFGLSERQAHGLLCSCINGSAIEGGRLARKLRRLAAELSAWHGLVRSLRSRLTPFFGPVADRQ